MLSSTPTTGFQEAFDNFLSALIKASIEEGEISLDQNVIDPFHRIPVPSNATIPRKLISLFEGKKKSIGIRLAPNVLYTLSALLIQLPYSHAGEKLTFKLLDTILLYKNAAAAARDLTEIAQSGFEESDAADLAKRVVSEDAVHERRRYICRRLYPLSLRLICNRVKTKHSRRLGALVAVALIGVDHVAAQTIQQDSAYQCLGELLRDESDYVLRFLVADLMRELFNTGSVTEDLLFKSFNGGRAPALFGEPHSHSLWIRDMFEILSTIDTAKPVSDSNDRVFKLRTVDIGDGLYEDKAGNMLAIFSNTINFLLPADTHSPLQLIEVCTKNANMARVTTDMIDPDSKDNTSGLVTVMMPDRDGDRFVKGTRKAVDLLQFGLADPDDVGALAQTLHHFSTTVSRIMNFDNVPHVGGPEFVCEKQSIMFTDMTLFSEDDTSTSVVEAASLTTHEMDERVENQPSPIVNRGGKHALHDVERPSEYDPRKEDSAENFHQMTGRRLQSLDDVSKTDLGALTTPQLSSELDDLSVMDEQEIESPSLQASQSRVRRQELKETATITTRQAQPSRIANDLQGETNKSVQLASLLVLPSNSVVETSKPRSSRNFESEHGVRKFQTTSDEPIVRSFCLDSTKTNPLGDGVDPAQAPTPVQQSGSLLKGAPDMARLAKSGSSKLKTRRKQPSESPSSDSVIHKTNQDIYDLEPGDEPVKPPKRAENSLKRISTNSKTAVPHEPPPGAISKPLNRSMRKSTSKSVISSKLPKESQIKTATATRTRHALAVKSKAYTEGIAKDDGTNALNSDAGRSIEVTDQKLRETGVKQKANTKGSWQGTPLIEKPASDPVTPFKGVQNNIPTTQEPIIISSTLSESRDEYGLDHSVTTREYGTSQEAGLHKTIQSDVISIRRPKIQSHATAKVSATALSKQSNQESKDEDAFAEDSYPQATIATPKNNRNSNIAFGSLLERMTQFQRASMNAPATPFGNKKEFVKHVNDRKSTSPQKSDRRKYSEACGTLTHNLEGTEGRSVQLHDGTNKNAAAMYVNISQEPNPHMLDEARNRRKNGDIPQVDNSESQKHHEGLQDPAIFKQISDHQPPTGARNTEVVHRESASTAPTSEPLHGPNGFSINNGVIQQTKSSSHKSTLGPDLEVKSIKTDAGQVETSKLAMSAIKHIDSDHSLAGTFAERDQRSNENSGSRDTNEDGKRHTAPNTPLRKIFQTQVDLVHNFHLGQVLQPVQLAQTSPKAATIGNVSRAPKSVLPKIQRGGALHAMPDERLQRTDDVVRFGPEGAINQVLYHTRAKSRYSLPASIQKLRQGSTSLRKTPQHTPVELANHHEVIQIPIISGKSTQDQDSGENSMSDYIDDDEYTAAYDFARDRMSRSESTADPSEIAGNRIPDVAVHGHLPSSPCSKTYTTELSRSIETIGEGASLDSAESVGEEDSEYVDSQPGPKTTILRTRIMKTNIVKPYFEPSHPSDSDSFPTIQNPGSRKMTAVTARETVGPNTLYTDDNASIGRSLGNIARASQQKTIDIDKFIEPDTGPGSKRVDMLHALTSPQVGKVSRQVKQFTAEEEQGGNLSKGKSDILMPPPKRRSLVVGEQPSVPASSSVVTTQTTSLRQQPKPTTPDIALRPRRIKRKPDINPMFHDPTVPVGTPMGFSTFLDAETNYINRGAELQPAERTPGYQNGNDISNTDPETTLLNDVPFSNQSIFNLNRRSGMTEDTISSSGPESEGTPAPQYRRRKEGLSNLNDIQRNIHTTILGIADSVLFRLGAEEHAVNTKLAIYERGGQIALDQFQELVNSRMKHEIEAMTQLLRAERRKLKGMVEQAWADRFEPDVFITIDSIFMEIDGKETDLIARLDNIRT